jgi:hypothetical protein
MKDVSDVIGSVKDVKGENNYMQFIRASIHIFIRVLALIRRF